MLRALGAYVTSVMKGHPSAMICDWRQALLQGYSTAPFCERVRKLAESGLSGQFRWHAVHQNEPRCTVLLLHPPGACSAFTRSGSQYPPLGLLQLKALIGDRSRVDVIEADGHRLSDNETAQLIADIAPVALGMTVTCGTKPLTHAWSTVARNLASGYDPIIIVGGPAAAFESQSILSDCPNVDVVVKGEGEVTFPQIVEILEGPTKCTRRESLAQLSRLPGVCVRGMPEVNDMKIPKLPKGAFETLPFPDLSSSPVSGCGARFTCVVHAEFLIWCIMSHD